MQASSGAVEACAAAASGERSSGEVTAALAPVAAGRFVPGSTLADGRRARVVLAEDRVRGGAVVLKLPKGASAAAASAAVAREARGLALSRHAHVVELVEHGVAQDLGPFVAVAHHEGRTLASLVAERGALSEGWARRALAQLAAALKAVHDAGGAHGDVAPANVLAVGFASFDEPPRVCLLDFDASWWPEDAASTSTLGTAVYLAPERAGGGPPSRLADVYAWGALAYELLAGVPPFRASSSAALARLHEQEPPRPLREVAPSAKVDPRLERVVLRCLQKDPKARPASMSELLDTLAELDAGATAARARDEDELRSTLLARVREYWIENVLERATDGVILVRQSLVDTSDPSMAEAVLENVAFPRAFDDTSGAVVLLGEPGFGKTVNLLRLARHLADRAVDREGHIGALPVVFTLSSWTETDSSLDEWMGLELRAKYQLLQRDAKALLERGAIIPLLDGLDDVPRAAQARCVAALNAWVGARPGARLVVTCRTADYRAQERAVDASRTMELRPLAGGDIARQLRGPKHEPLLSALEHDPILSELSSTPVLLHVMRVGLRDSTRFQGALADRAATVGAVFAAFVDAAVVEGGKIEGREQATRAALQRVASLLATTGRTVFHLEDADPEWLGSRRQRVAYAFVSRALAATLLALAPMLSIGFSPLQNQGLPVSMTFAAYLALVTAVVLGLGFGATAARRQGRAAPQRSSRLATAARGLAAGLGLGAVIGGLVYAVYPYPMAFFMGIESGLIGAGVLVLSRHKCRARGRDVVPLESLGWSWRNVDPRGAAALAVFTAAFFALFSHFEEMRSGGYMAAALLLLGVAVLGHRSRDLQVKATPNLGIRRTLRSALAAAALAFSTSTILFGLSYGVGYGAAVGIALGGITGLCFGGVDLVNHYTVRWLLDGRGVLPLRVAERLDDGVAVGLVRRVGSGYMFMHAMLQRHLAERGREGGA